MIVKIQPDVRQKLIQNWTARIGALVERPCMYKYNYATKAVRPFIVATARPFVRYRLAH